MLRWKGLAVSIPSKIWVGLAVSLPSKYPLDMGFNRDVRFNPAVPCVPTCHLPLGKIFPTQPPHNLLKRYKLCINICCSIYQQP
eukprot:7015381-Ditylum_brightwellii.AAC.1